MSSKEIIYLFDLDNTLTLPRQEMSDDFVHTFDRFISKYNVAIVTGSDINKVRSQVPERILTKISRLYTCMGNEYYIKNKLGFSSPKINNPELVNDLNSIVSRSKYPFKFSNNIEFRPGMINFSILGRDCSQQDRQEYFEWDLKNRQRAIKREFLQDKYPEYRFEIGGQISMDIIPEGHGKEQVAEILSDYHIKFFGDQIEDGGNDYYLSEYIKDNNLGDVISVKNCFETRDILLTLL